MKNILSKLTIAFLLLAFSCAYGEVFSWVDKDGKKHFGEKVPKEYLNQSSALQVKPINTMDATKVAKPSTEAPKTTQFQHFVPPQPEQNDSPQLSNCEMQKRAYEESVKCYSRCQINNGNPNHINNVSACSGCADVKKPSC